MDSALAMLPPDDVNPALAASELIEVAGTVRAAYRLAAETLKVVSPEDEAEKSDESKD